jgi:hypothetical protein
MFFEILAQIETAKDAFLDKHGVAPNLLIVSPDVFRWLERVQTVKPDNLFGRTIGDCLQNASFDDIAPFIKKESLMADMRYVGMSVIIADIEGFTLAFGMGESTDE